MALPSHASPPVLPLCGPATSSKFQLMSAPVEKIVAD
jgi:hypothetical protein